MTWRSAVAGACAVGTCCCACAEPGSPTTAAGCVPRAAVVAVSGRQSGQTEFASNIWLVAADGTVRALTEDDRAFGPSLSPDGLTTVYLRNDGTAIADSPAMPTELWRQKTDGSDARRVAYSRGFYDVAFSPDGNTEAVVSQGAILNAPPPAATTAPDPTAITTFPSTADPGSAPTGNVDRPLVWIVGAGGSHALTPPPASPTVRQTIPSWNPAGDEVAFIESDDASVTDRARIVIADAESGEVRADAAMPSGTTSVTDLRWDDDDTIRALTRDVAGSWSVVTMRSDLTTAAEDETVGDAYNVALAPGGKLLRVLEGAQSFALELPTGRTVTTSLVSVGRPSVARCSPS